jgi:RNA polymerase sigma factor (sigma-70 family)
VSKYYEPRMDPETETEWLMQPHEEVPNLDESHIDAVALIIDKLSPRDRQVIEAIFFERKSYQQLADRLGCSKPHAWRITQAAMNRLKSLLLESTSITERYDLND